MKKNGTQTHFYRSDREGMIHDKNRVGALRGSAKAGIKAIDELRSKTTDSGFHEILVLPEHWFVDIESFFIPQLESRADRTPAEEALLLNAAEGTLNMANQKLRQLQEMFKTYGPGITAV